MSYKISLYRNPDGRFLNHISTAFNAIAMFGLGAAIFDTTLAILSPLNHGFSPTRDLIIAFATVILFRKIGNKFSALSNSQEERFLQEKLARHLEIP